MKRLLVILGIMISCLLAPSFAYASIVNSYSVSGSAPYSYYNYSGGYYTWKSAASLLATQDQFTLMSSFSTNINGYSANGLYYTLSWSDGTNYGQYAGTTTQTGLSSPITAYSYGNYVTAYSLLYYFPSPGSVSTILNYTAIYSKYQLDGYSYYIDSSGFVHFVITQNSPNVNITYGLINTTTGAFITGGNKSSSSFELVDTNPKVGASNIYSINLSANGYSYGPVQSNPQYKNIYVQVPGDMATYNTLTQGANGDGKSLDATYDKANSAYASAQAAQSAAQAAQTAATTASNQTWYGGKYGGSSEDVADTAGYIR